MAIVKSKLLKQLSKNYPNFLKKDLEKIIDIILDEIKVTLKKENGSNLEDSEFFLLTYKKLEFQETQEQVKK